MIRYNYGKISLVFFQLILIYHQTKNNHYGVEKKLYIYIYMYLSLSLYIYI